MTEFDWIARAQARRYSCYLGGCIELEDLVQEARLGILHGMPRWREGAGANRATWASMWARSYIHRYVEQHRNQVRIPTGDDVARKKGQLKCLPTRDIDDVAWSLGAEGSEPTEPRLGAAFATLRPSWRYLLTERYAAGRTLQDLAKESGRTRQAVDHVIQRALQQLRAELRSPFTAQTAPERQGKRHA
jgi:RNA polymerase sigma factor (sigma-70 family)